MAPKVSMLMPTYNQVGFVEAALDSVFAQTYDNIELLVFDDASSDGTWDVVQACCAAHTGPQTVVLHRQPKNLGPHDNGVAAANAATGELLMLAYGDDVSHPERVAKVVAAWQASGASLVAHNALTGADPEDPDKQMVGEGVSGVVSLVELSGVCWDERMLGATFAWTRNLWDVFGRFDPALVPRGGDHLLPFRAALLTGFCYVHEPLLFWRRHRGQVTASISDFEGHPLAMGETNTAYNMNTLLQRIRDVDFIVEREGSRPEWTQARRKTLEMVAGMSLTWSRYRALLRARGATLDWPARQRGRA